MKRLPIIGALLAFTLLFGAAPPTRAQDNQGPMAPPPKFEVKRIPSVPHPGPPPIPQEEIIRKFAANEDAAKKAYDTYNFTQTIRLEELTDPGGKFSVTGEMYTRPDGGRFWRVKKEPVSSLKLTSYTLEDVRTIVSMPLFFLTTDRIENYDFLYAGQQKLDELNTYVFQVKPKQLSRTQLQFQGVIFVDDHDLAIVETYGKFVSELVAEEGATKLPFSLYETYRENFQDKYWLPTYTTSDDYIDTPGADQLHLRLVVRSTDFKLNTGPAPAPAPLPAPSGPPLHELPQPR
ncbi:MAG TPA: hypothetical protein VN822_01765 [Candidatus Acidoferrales bacterium]|nr:hypothetical protein [Candidatus Acidoferrales bacterium]